MALNYKQVLYVLLWMLLAFLVGLYLFSIIVEMPGVIDMQEHNSIIHGVIEGKYLMAPHFLYFLLVILLSKISSVSTASVIILSIAVSFKLLATKQIIGNSLLFAEEVPKETRAVISKFIFPLSFLLLFLTNMPNKLFGTDNLPPISWHNSTIIMLMPFSLWLFWYSFSYFRDANKKHLFYIGILSFFSVIIKPNFILVFIVVFPLFLLYRYRFSMTSIRVFLIIVFIAACLAAQYYYTYSYLSEKALTKMYNQVHIVLGPFDSWHRISGNLFFSFIAWALYPIAFLVFYFKSALKSTMYNYALSLFILGFLIFILFTEKDATGKDIGAVNFIWQVIMCHYILFLTSMIEQIKIMSKRGAFQIRDYALSAIFIAYILSGVAYVVRTIVLS